MKIKNVLITGGTGKIGAAALPELVKAGYSVRALQFERPITEPGVEVIQGTLADPTLAARAIEDMDAVVHLANVKENRDKFMSVNVQGSFSLLDAAYRSGHIKQFVQAGSDARAGIFYHPHPVPLAEAAPHWAYPGYYAFSKVLEEVMCEQYRIQYNLPITVLRYSWVYTEDDVLAHVTLREPNFGVPIWEEEAVTPEQKAYFEKDMDGVALLTHPDGKPGVRHVVGLPDVVQSIMLALGNPTAVGHAFTIAAPSAFSYDVLAKYVSEKLDLPIVEFAYEGFYDFSHDLSKSRAILGYNPQYDIFRLVDEAVEFRKAGKQRSPIKYIG